MVIKRFKNFILESDNLSKSQTALDKFGMSNYDELPYIVQEACKKAGLKYSESYPYIDGFGRKNYIFNSDDFEIVIGMTHNENNKFDSDSKVYVYMSQIDDNNIGFSFVDDRNNPKRTIKFLENMTEIMEKIQDSIKKDLNFTPILQKYGLYGDKFWVH